MSLRDKLVGAWELIEYSAHLPNDVTNKKYPQGPDAKGIIMYTPDGYMSAQLLTPGQEKFVPPGTTDDWTQVGKSYVAYTGHFYLDEDGDELGPVLHHHMRTTNLPYLLGDTQRRLVTIKDEGDGRYLYLAPVGTMPVFGEDRIVNVRWKRLPDNRNSKPKVSL